MNKHIILTNGRSGSNYISGVLNSHPHITNYGEVLGEWTVPYMIYDKFFKYRMSSESYLDYMYNSKFFFNAAQIYSAYSKIKRKEKINFKSYKQIKSLGIKEFSINFFRRNIDNYLASKKNIFVINLYRENSLARLVSIEAMTTTGIVSTQKKLGKIKIYLNPEGILERLNIFEKEKKDQFDLIENLEQKFIFNISYEEYFASPESQRELTKKIFEFLKVEPIDVTLNQKKILSRKLSNTVENYEEIVSILKGTQYEQYLFD
ncbi:hypothetical protein [Gloeothece verrucosa]|uniref:Sulphotransferase Stf0 domain-containing protein n=1 Tax=Gloeothece verrucosa (strain PCC 7822) TaxID=497965 RepID=E0UC60_GLOV7|nr:hypothetical protein [Gloeothece verrucosa]ADN16398.1 hypothetical protein Cyan7822_4488 [Gloeothece verrucosa PCC 7822]